MAKPAAKRQRGVGATSDAVIEYVSIRPRAEDQARQRQLLPKAVGEPTAKRRCMGAGVGTQANKPRLTEEVAGQERRCPAYAAQTTIASNVGGQ